MIKVLFSLSFLSILPAQAMDLDDPSQEGKSSGRYPLYQNSNADTVMGNATLFQIKDGKYFGITCAHCVPYLENSLSFLFTNEEKIDETYSRTSVAFIDNISIHPLYKEEKEFKVENSKYDLALFTIKGNPKLGSFKEGIFTGEVKDQTNYSITVDSFGPLFAKDDSSHEESKFHRLQSTVRMNKDGLLLHSFQARDFYISFDPMPDTTYGITYGLLSNSTNVVVGDSGSLAVMEDGKAFAIVSAVDMNLRPFLQLAQFSEDVLRDQKLDEEFKNKVLNEVKTKIASCTRTFKKPSGKEIFLFKLKEEIPAIKANDYYTLLAPQAQFINEYINNISEDDEKTTSAFRYISIDKENDSYENPDALEEYANLEERTEELADQKANLKTHLGDEVYASAKSEWELIKASMASKKESDEKESDEISFIQINRDSDVYNDPDAAEVYINTSLALEDMAINIDALREDMDPSDLALIENFDWEASDETAEEKKQ